MFIRAKKGKLFALILAVVIITSGLGCWFFGRNKEAIEVTISQTHTASYRSSPSTVPGKSSAIELTTSRTHTASERPIILFDESHGVMTITPFGTNYKIPLTVSTGFSYVSQILSNAGFKVDVLASKPINGEILSGVAVLILTPSRDALTMDEIASIIRFVEDGGGLLLMGQCGFQGYGELSSEFGITFESEILCDPAYSTPVKPFHVEIRDLVDHEITTNVRSFLYDWGQPLKTQDPAIPVAFSSNTSWSERNYNGLREEGEPLGRKVVLAASLYGKGRVVGIGVATSFSNISVIGYNGNDEYQTEQLLFNVINWLSRSNLSGLDLRYKMSVTSESSQRNLAHIKIGVERLYGNRITFTMERWADNNLYPSPIENFKATDSVGNRLRVEYKVEGKSRFWTVETNANTRLNVEYDLYLNYLRKDFNEYAGYLGKNFGLSEAAGAFLIPINYHISGIRIIFDLPKDWCAHAPWEGGQEEYHVTPVFTVSLKKSFLRATFAIGPFESYTHVFNSTLVSIVVFKGWDNDTRYMIAEYSFQIYDYVQKLFGAPPPLEKYVAIWTPRADDGRGVTECEWSSSQGLSVSIPFKIEGGELANYAHRIFHVWNAFEPTGLRSDLWGDELWFWEGVNVYYDYKILSDLKLLRKDVSQLPYLKNFLREYESQIVGTKYDVPLTDLQKYANWEEFNPFTVQAYHKGALISYMLDEIIKKVTSENNDLGDLIESVYKEYGGYKGSFSNKILLDQLGNITGYNFTIFFENYIYGNERLPLRIQNDRIIIDWPKLFEKTQIKKVS